ncbi:MAG TPA: hypothetical protein VK211_29095 [Kamptonema sp.]|nr:hypothetical protein [Kamptonema sp.]
MKIPLPLPEAIAWIPRRQAMELLFISSAQLRRDVAVLQALEPAGWKYQSNSRGFRRPALECLWYFRQLVQVRGRVEAIASINQFMEDLNSERSGSSGRKCG